jgi:hypothetical protein
MRAVGRQFQFGRPTCGHTRPVAAPEETTRQGHQTPIATGRPAGCRTPPRREDVQDDQPGPRRREAGSRLSAAIQAVGAGGTEDTMERRAELLGRDPVVGAAGGAVCGHRTDRCSRGLCADRTAWCSAIAHCAPRRPVIRRSGGCVGPAQGSDPRGPDLSAVHGGGRPLPKLRVQKPVCGRWRTSAFIDAASVYPPLAYTISSYGVH